jgi:hypothetical protein
MPSPPSVSNYVKTTGYSLDGNLWQDCGKYWPMVGAESPKNTERVAWMCNQIDDCAGFMTDKDGNGMWMWLKSWNPGKAVTLKRDSNYIFYQKSASNKARKAYTPNYYNPSDGTGDPSIIRNPATKVWFNNGDGKKTWGWNIPGASGAQGTTQAGIFISDGQPRNADYGCCNNMHDVQVPLGWRFLNGDNGTFSGCGGGAHAWLMEGNGSNYHIADGAWDDGVLLENRGFDVVSYWDTMTQYGVEPVDAARIKTNWCTSSIANMSSSKCSAYYNVPVSSGGPTNTFNNDAMTLCARNGYNWASDTFCVNRVNDALSNGSSSDKSMATSMINNFCSSGSNNQNPACACYNAVHAGSVAACVSQPSLPGCDSIATKVNALTPAAATFYQNDPQGLSPYCACDQCKQAENSTDGTILRQNPANCNSTLNACFQNNSVNEFTGGNLNASCNFNPPSPSSGGGGSPSSSPSGGGGGTGPAPSPSGNSNLIYELIGGGFGLFSFFCVFIFLLLIALN